MATINDGSNKVRPPGPPTENDTMLTRSDVASIFGCSLSSVRRMEGEVLHPTLDAKGVHCFSLLEVLQVQKKRSAQVGGATKDGDRDARAFEVFNAGGEIRDVVAQLRVTADLAERLYNQWRRAGAHDVVVTPQIKAELVRYLGAFRDARELVQRSREQSAENDRLHSDCDAIGNRMSGVAVAIGLLAVRIPALADALPDIRVKLGSEASEALECAMAAWRSSANVPNTAANAASTVHAEERHQALVAASQAATACPEVSPEVPVSEAPARTTAPPPERAEPRREIASDGARASAEVPGTDASAAPTRPASGAGCERLLDQLLASLVADDARLDKLVALLQRAEVLMLAELERRIGAAGDGKRMEILDALLVSLSNDEARLERIGALLTPTELDLLVELRKRNAGA